MNPSETLENPPAQPLRSLFVTGTDTGVGKTAVTAALAQRCAREMGRVAALKPVVSGVEANGQWSDVEILRTASTPSRSFEQTCLYALDPPIAPHWAAAQAGLTLDRHKIQRFIEQQSADMDAVLVEGAGGFLVPLGDNWSFADLALGLQFPVLLVVGLRLGAINHALLSAEAILARALPMAGWVASHLQPDLAPGTLETLQRLMPSPCLGEIPFQAEASSVCRSQYLSLPACWD
ncbi:dethiobiotin synthase [Acidithiobacillus thiooxidans]|uniref:dethiobiotin synthase n=1 Tax=Acidithiobacillus TaxID=119977 RepID=UPI00187B0C4B|nr:MULTISPECIES: dethiobiotin synthase [Acidithiobacillus]MBE7566136.1 dethiobiotin synthase [Acidithiobacillus sp. HP-11]MBU2749817.1 dethiobiotin synthase [Acidithiobacillus thiooxidans]MBU2794021.1 dethiobiotin synthase [Acidithiobacillus thiooxidans]